MSLTYYECVAVLEAFQGENRRLYNNKVVCGTRIMFEKNEPRLELLCSSINIAQDVVSRHFNGKLLFSAEIGEKTYELQVRIVEKEYVYAQARAGDAAFGDGLPGNGTLGWNFIIDGTVVALSNLHVFCPEGNDTALGLDVFLDGAHEADLSAFQRLQTRNNVWDYALATYRNPALALAQMRICDDGAGTVHPYPVELSDPDSVVVGDGEMYRKVGDTSPRCRTGTLDGVGSFWVDYGSLGLFHFKNQLIFSKMTDPGDSGSVIVRVSDNTVTGLHYAGDDGESNSNPIFQAGWQYLGALRLSKNSPDVPCFRSDPSVKDAPPSPDNRGKGASPSSVHAELRIPYWGPFGDDEQVGVKAATNGDPNFFTLSNFEGIPDFTSGKSILDTVSRPEDVPADTVEVVDLLNGLLLCLGDRENHGFGILRAWPLAIPASVNPPSIRLGESVDMAYREPKFRWHSWLKLLDRNASDAMFVLGFASHTYSATINLTHLSSLGGFSTFERPFSPHSVFRGSWDVPPPPPTPTAPTVNTIEVMAKHSDKRDNYSGFGPVDELGHYLTRTFTKYYICFG